jgi:hypothetical protein
MLSFSAILFTTLGGFLGAPIWVAVAGASILLLVSLFLHEQIYTAYETRTNRVAQTLLLSGSLVNAAMTAGAAFGLGQLLRFIWTY